MANYIVLDTETAPIVKRDFVSPTDSAVYDFGFIVCNSKGEALEKRSYVIAETFNDSALMNSAYYANKLPQYRAGIGFDSDSEWQMVDCLTAYREFRNVCKKYGVKTVWAYNVNFDVKALNATVSRLSNGFVNFFMPYGVRVRDIWDYATCITTSKGFLKFCDCNGYVSPKGNPKTSAEVVYRYLKGDTDFIERHTALSDCEIENAILSKCKKMHKKTRHTCGQGWVEAAKAYREYLALNE